MNNTNYEQKYLKYKFKYLKLKELAGGNRIVNETVNETEYDSFLKSFNKIFGIKPEVKPEENDDISEISYNIHNEHAKIIKKHTEIESETEGFEHGHH